MESSLGNHLFLHHPHPHPLALEPSHAAPIAKLFSRFRASEEKKEGRHLIYPNIFYWKSLDLPEGIMNSTVPEYIEKKQLRVVRNLKVAQSFEDLEATFGPGRTLGFDAVLKLLD